ncbi:MAG: amidohydrolase family protein, partial [Hyphococcus sp.]
MTVIDVWSQIITERFAHAPWLATLLRWTGQTGEAMLPSVESTIDAMDKAGVQISLLSAWCGPDGAL